MLSGDPVGSFSLTLRGVGRCVTFVLQWGIPTMLLGGGQWKQTEHSASFPSLVYTQAVIKNSLATYPSSNC